MISLLRHEIRVRRRTILGWALGLGFFAAMYMAFYPSLPEEMRNLDMESIDIYKSMGVQSMATFDGYLKSSVLNFLPLLVGAFGIVLGAGALAGEEDAGTLELLASLPLSRLRLYLAKTVAVLVAAFLVVLVVALGEVAVFLLIESDLDTTITAADIFWVILANWLIALVFIALGLLLGAFLPSRGTALAVASALLVLTFFGNNLSGLVTELERVQPLFPFSYFGRVYEALGGEVPWEDVAVLLAMGAAGLVLGAVGFRRRDLTVGAWPWQRARLPAAARLPDAASSAAPAPQPREAAPIHPAAARSDRVVMVLALAALAACACLATSGAALLVSEDLRADVRDRLGLEEEGVVKASGELERRSVAVLAAARGPVISVLATVGQEVEAGAAILVLAGPDAAPSRVWAQLVTERAWVVLEELAEGRTDIGIDALQAGVETADADAVAAEERWREVAAAGSPGEAEERRSLARLYAAARDLAGARLALAEGRVTDADVRAAGAALAEAQAHLGETPPSLKLRTLDAPLTGTVSGIFVGVGDVVAAPQEVARLTDRSRYQVVVRLDREDGERVEVGQEVEVEVEGEDGSFDGRVMEIVDRDEAAHASGADEDDALPFAVRVAIDDPDGRLETGASVDLRILVE